MIAAFTIAFFFGTAFVSLPTAGLPVAAVAAALSAAAEEEGGIAKGMEDLRSAGLKAGPLLVLTAAAFDPEEAALCCSDGRQAEAALEASGGNGGFLPGRVLALPATWSAAAATSG